MPFFLAHSRFPVPAGELFAWHERPGAFERLAPPWERIEVLEREGGIRDGGRLVMAIRKGPLRLRWVAEHFGYEAGSEFRDRQAKGPFAFWVHRHRCLPMADGSELRDELEYRLPGGIAGRVLGGWSARRMLRRMFLFRHRRTRVDLERHRAFADRGTLRIAVTGASGLVGRQLVPFLQGGGHEVLRLVRREADPGEGEIAWNPSAGTIDADALEGVDAVVHLAAEGIARRRWWKRQRERILRSRVDGTKLLSETPRAWEEATGPAAAAGIRVVNLRIGRVLSPEGGTLLWLLRPGRLASGGWVGSGRTPVSWIARDDLVGVVQHAIFTDALSGPVNAVAPSRTTQIQLVRATGRVVRWPTLLPTLPLLVHLLDGERGRFLRLTGAHVRPRALVRSGFTFRWPALEEAIRWETGRLRDAEDVVLVER
jgi:NAD dependent epimerase/dehydratase family enzyme